ncbi:BRCT domain-containing protein [Dechloromonas sp. A34]|uniref:BRCT domain-containing protein n=1 Tax=Dechloromonas sp. A34 TaxID=447588 RepID=UPI00224946E1|nr:BRCT domain-containing protein [Dechloromonas sp. A34]
MENAYDPEDPRLLRIHADRIIKRDIDQLLGICEFALQDGHIDQTEAHSILSWLHNHRLSIDTWPASVLYDRLRYMLADGHLDEDEQRDLLTLIMNIASPRSSAGNVVPTALPLNTPAPPVTIEGHSFCFTGVFDFGKRADCHGAIEQRGGIPAGSITKKLHYLVIGNIGSDVWRHSSFGSKIAKAVDYREAGAPLAIISESYWAARLR